MAAGTLVPLDEYLTTSYDPDREYVDGCLIERNVGEYNHGFLQLIVAMALKALHLRTYVELRLQVRPNRFRIPGVTALKPGQKRTGRYQTETPLIVIEILSPDDRIVDLNDKLNDYFAMQIPNIWVVDPEARTLTVHQPAESHTFTDRVTTTGREASIDLGEIFRQLAEDQMQ